MVRRQGLNLDDDSTIKAFLLRLDTRTLSKKSLQTSSTPDTPSSSQQSQLVPDENVPSSALMHSAQDTPPFSKVIAHDMVCEVKLLTL